MFLLDQRPFPILKFTGTEASEVTVHKTLQKVDSSTPEAVKKYEVLLYKAEQLYRKELAAWREKYQKPNIILLFACLILSVITTLQAKSLPKEKSLDFTGYKEIAPTGTVKVREFRPAVALQQLGHYFKHLLL